MTPPDVLAHRAWLTSLVDLPTRGLVVDLGCGRGEDLLALAARAGMGARFEGIDRSDESIAAARSAGARQPAVHFHVHESSGALPWPDGSVDVVYSNNLLECVVDKDAWLREVSAVVGRLSGIGHVRG